MWPRIHRESFMRMYSSFGRKGLIVFTIIMPILVVGLAHSSDWVWQNPLPQGNTFHGIWGSSPSNVFAVGKVGTILHYNGSTWSPIPTGTTKTLTGVWGSSASNVFVVGGNGKILHYNGSNWSPMASGTTTTLNGIWGAREAMSLPWGRPV